MGRFSIVTATAPLRGLAPRLLAIVTRGTRLRDSGGAFEHAAAQLADLCARLRGSSNISQIRNLLANHAKGAASTPRAAMAARLFEVVIDQPLRSAIY